MKRAVHNPELGVDQKEMNGSKDVRTVFRGHAEGHFQDWPTHRGGLVPADRPL